MTDVAPVLFLYACIVLCACVSSWLYIGLAQTTECTCVGASSADCTACRDGWHWLDGTLMTYANWAESEPGWYGCGVMDELGWHGKYCYGSLRYLCVKGNAAAIFHPDYTFSYCGAVLCDDVLRDMYTHM